MEARVEYIGDWVHVKIPKALVVIPLSVWKQGFKRGKVWKRRERMEERESARLGR